MALDFSTVPSSSPIRQFLAYTMSSSPVLPQPSETQAKRSMVMRAGSRTSILPLKPSRSFTTASALLRKATTESAHDILQASASNKRNDVDSSSFISTEPVKPKTKKLLVRKTADDGEPSISNDLKELPTDLTANLSVTKKPRKPRTTKHKDTISGDDPLPAKKAVRKARAKLTPKSEDGTAKEPALKPKPSTKKAEEIVGSKEPIQQPAPKKSRAKKTDNESETGNVVKEKPIRKPRAKKLDGESQTLLPRGRVTKVPSRQKSDKAKEVLLEKSTGTPETIEEGFNLGLEKAVKRRATWTPPTSNTQSISLIDSSPVIIDYGHDSGSLEPRSKVFPDLLGSFGFTSDLLAVPSKSEHGIMTKKRKLIELVNSGSISEGAAKPKDKVVKEKAPKKKPKTLTDQATSAYIEEEEVPPEPAPLLQYFEYKSKARATFDGFKKPTKSRSKKLITSTAKSKQNFALVPILLSPESVLKQISNQDFVFGTSSQLAREESPTFLREIHEAMQASNEVDSDPLTEADVKSHVPVFSRSKVVPSRRGALWYAGARGADGNSIDIEMVDGVGTEPSSTAREATSSSVTVLSQSTGNTSEWLDVDEACDLSNERTSNPPVDTTEMGPIEAAIKMGLASSSPAARKPKSPSKPTGGRSKVPSPKASAVALKSSKKGSLSMPEYSAYTTAQLAKEIASYHFKPVKGRDQMITLLQKCWEGKNRVALGKLGTNMSVKSPSKSAGDVPPPSQQDASKPLERPKKVSITDDSTSLKFKGKIGRPKKTDTVEFLELDSDTRLSQVRTPKKLATTRKQDIEEILDSDAPSTPSPPRRRASQIGSQPRQLELTSSLQASPELSDAESQLLLFKHISAAVISAAPTKDPKKPSWHEQILLYDPIILEDLAVWLNTGALERVGWDGEVAPFQVKKWCESKSVCCLWKENLRGGVRSRY